jgi:hypothetical protein
VRSSKSLRDLLVILNKAIGIEIRLRSPGFAGEILRYVDTSELEWLVARGLAGADTQVALLVAYGILLVDALRLDGLTHLSVAVRRMRASLVSAARSEPRVVHRALIQILAGAPSTDVMYTAQASDWPRLWERGLASLFWDLVHSESGSPFLAAATNASLTLTDAWELSEDAPNVQFGMAWQFVQQLGVAANLLDTLGAEATERADDEVVSSTRWLLRGSDRRATRPTPVLHLWSLLNATVLRPTYLPWAQEAERSLRARVFGKEGPSDWRILAS